MKHPLCEFWEIELGHRFTEGKNGHIKWRKVECSISGKAGCGEAMVKGDRIAKPFFAEDLVRKI